MVRGTTGVILGFLPVLIMVFVVGCGDSGTGPDSSDGSSFFKLYAYPPIMTELPCFVIIPFQVTDGNGLGVSNLTTGDFNIYEDGNPVSPTESFPLIKKRQELPYRLKTVLMIDNSASVGANLEEIKNAAKVLVSKIEDQQEIAIFKFSERAELVQGFTSNVRTLTSAIDSISLGYATTDLYGSVIIGVSQWDDYQERDSVQQGFMIILTDGSDTQHSFTIDQAVAFRGNKRIYAIGMGNEIEPDKLDSIGNAGFYPITSASEVSTKFQEIQDEMIAWANSFYWFYYMSPTRYGVHELTLELKNNSNAGSNSQIIGSFNSDGFYSVLAGVDIKLADDAAYGRNSIYGYLDSTITIYAATYQAAESPAYAWSTNSDSIEINPFGSDNSAAHVTVIGEISPAEASFTVTDTVNHLSKTVAVIFPPLVTTAAVTDITKTTARCGGNVTSDGGAEVTARGVCWSKNPMPTIEDNKTVDGSGVGSFTSSPAGLTFGTRYYVRAYATNSAGSGYGEERSFTTERPDSTGTVTDCDGNEYMTIKIGDQWWMMENLKVTHYRNGDPIPHVTDDSAWAGLSTGASCNYDNDEGNVAIYGRLYNWYAVDDSRNLAPEGWHVPTDEEWKHLEMFLGMSQAEADAFSWRGTDEGGKLKETGTTHWISPNEGATNESGFSALPGGYRYNRGRFGSIGIGAFFWSSTEFDSKGAWLRNLRYDSPQIDRAGNGSYKYYGFSVRCVRD